MATSKTTAIGTLTSVTKAPRITARPPSTSINMVDHAIKCGAGTPIACRIVAKAFRAPGEFGEAMFHEAIPIRRSGTGAQRAATSHRLPGSISITVVLRFISLQSPKTCEGVIELPTLDQARTLHHDIPSISRLKAITLRA